jgi:hypothetical protein
MQMPFLQRLDHHKVLKRNRQQAMRTQHPCKTRSLLPDLQHPNPNLSFANGA